MQTFLYTHPSIHPEKPRRLPEHLLGLIFGSGPFHLIAVTQRCVIFQFPLIPVYVTDPDLKTKLNLLSSAIMWRFTTVLSSASPVVWLSGMPLSLTYLCSITVFTHTYRFRASLCRNVQHFFRLPVSVDTEMLHFGKVKIALFRTPLTISSG